MGKREKASRGMYGDRTDTSVTVVQSLLALRWVWFGHGHMGTAKDTTEAPGGDKGERVRRRGSGREGEIGVIRVRKVQYRT